MALNLKDLRVNDRVRLIAPLHHGLVKVGSVGKVIDILTIEDTKDIVISFPYTSKHLGTKSTWEAWWPLSNRPTNLVRI